MNQNIQGCINAWNNAGLINSSSTGDTKLRGAQ